MSSSDKVQPTAVDSKGRKAEKLRRCSFPENVAEEKIIARRGKFLVHKVLATLATMAILAVSNYLLYALHNWGRSAKS
jgi:hypothetical protein